MMRDGAVFDSLPAHEFARRIKQHFVRVDVAVVVRRWNRVRVEVVGPRAERADDESIALKRLVHRRWLMNASNNRLEIVDAERPRIEVSVPADDVERMMVEHQFVDRAVLLDQDRKVTPLIARGQLCGTPDVTLAIRRAFEELTEFVAIALRPPHVSTTLEHKQLRRPRRGVET